MELNNRGKINDNLSLIEIDTNTALYTFGIVTIYTF